MIQTISEETCRNSIAYPNPLKAEQAAFNVMRLSKSKSERRPLSVVHCPHCMMFHTVTRQQMESQTREAKP